MIRRITIRWRGRCVYDSGGDDLAAARGVMVGLAIMLPLWALAVVLILR